VEAVGGRKPVKVDVRIISATNRRLLERVKQGHFREDLFYRLHVFPITVPPLRERPEDIPELTRHFLARFAAEEGKRISRIKAEALALLTAYRWPGNVRQLENAIFRAVVLAEGDEIDVHEFPQIAALVALAPVPPTDTLTVYPEPVDIAFGEPSPLPNHGESGSMTPAAAPAGFGSAALSLLDHNGDIRPLEDMETEVIRFAITHYRGQMSEVARRLRIGRSTLYRKLDQLGLDPEVSDRDSLPVVTG
jgi:DNA-binding NtrC family response regulator